MHTAVSVQSVHSVHFVVRLSIKQTTSHTNLSEKGVLVARGHDIGGTTEYTEKHGTKTETGTIDYCDELEELCRHLIV